MGIIGKQDMGKVPEEEGDPERKDETALGCLESLEWLGGMSLFEVGRRFVFCGDWSIVGHGFP